MLHNKYSIVLMAILFFALIQNIQAQNKRKIEILQSDSLDVNEFYGPDIKILRGNVQLYHDSATMFCDSAHYNTILNTFDAFGELHIEKLYQGDTIFLYGDSLTYNGQTKLARFRMNVRVIKDSVELNTDNLDFDLVDDVGYYFDNGITYSKEDTLKSVTGYYYAHTDQLYFKKEVVVINPDFVIKCDTLRHDLNTKTSHFLSPTHITSDQNLIYCENGWYNHNSDIAQFNKNAFLESKEHKLLGDSLYYDRKNGLGKAFLNVEIIDTVKSVKLTGNKAWYYEKTELSILSDKALFRQFGKTDTLYLHADTLMSEMDTTYFPDTLAYRIIRGFHHTKLFRNDVQTKCDSLVYTLNDSIINMYYEPVIWSGENQLSAKHIKMYTKNETIEKIDLNENAFIIERTDSLRFNQIWGKTMNGYIKNKKINRVDVFTDSKLIYFARDKGELTGVNKMECEDLKIYFNEEGKVSRIWFYTEPKGAMYPPFELSETDLYLNGFKWYSAYRPLTPDEIFIWEKPENELILKNTEKVTIDKR